MSLQALIFDVDGTLANTEHDGHLRAFNEAFEIFGLDWYWDSDLYGDLLSVSGGKERLAHYISKYSPSLDRSLGVEDIAEIHNKKTEIFISRIANGQITLRIGVERLIKEAIECNLRLAIATTTSFKNVEALMKSTLGKSALEYFEVVAAGDIVNKKKPAPDIYHYVLNQLNLSCDDCVAFEDSQIGFQAAISAGLKTVVTLSEYTKANNFEGALVVLDHLGEEDKPFLIINGTPSDYSMVSVDYIKELYERNR